MMSPTHSNASSESQKRDCSHQRTPAPGLVSLVRRTCVPVCEHAVNKRYVSGKFCPDEIVPMHLHCIFVQQSISCGLCLIKLLILCSSQSGRTCKNFSVQGPVWQTSTCQQGYTTSPYQPPLLVRDGYTMTDILTVLMFVRRIVILSIFDVSVCSVSLS